MKKNFVFILIKSLSKSEKRYFRLFCSREASGNNYLRLFDAIEKQSVYNEAVIKQQFKKEKFSKQLHVTKNYLRKLILKSLRNFHTGISKDAELKDTLRNIEILYNKELFKQCEDQLQLAEKLALKYELLVGSLQVRNWKRKLEQTQRPGNYKELNKILKEQKVALKKLHNTNDYWQLAVAMSGKMFQNQNSPIKNSSLLNSLKTALSLEAKVLFYNTTYLRFLEKGNIREAEKELITLIALLESLEDRLKEEPGLYVSSINNLVSFYVFNKNYKDAILLIQKAKKTYQGWKVTSENRTLLKQIMRTYNIELEIYRNTKNFENQDSFISDTEIFVMTNAHKIPKDYLASFQFQLASIHFMKKDLSRSLHWINLFLNSKSKSIRPDLRKQILLLNLMVHLERKNLMVLGYFVSSAKRFMKKVKELQPYEEILLRFFVKIGKVPLLEYKAEFVELRNKLFPKDSESIVPVEALGYIDYRNWIDRQLKKDKS